MVSAYILAPTYVFCKGWLAHIDKICYTKPKEGDERYDSFFCDSGRNATGFSGFDRGKCATC
jgi:hypothetical protein